MSSSILVSAAKIAGSLQTLELLLNQTTMAGLDLPTVVLRSIEDAGLGPLEGQAALLEATEIVTLITQARGRAGRVHQRILELAIKHQVPETAYGDIFPCDGDKVLFGATESLPAMRLVR